eukprot:4954966-Amphidinium_carterae.1
MSAGAAARQSTCRWAYGCCQVRCGEGNEKVLQDMQSHSRALTFLLPLSGCLLYTSPSPRDRG